MSNKSSTPSGQKNSTKSGQPTNTEPFLYFLLKNTGNKRYLLIALAGFLFQFIVFKLCYPFGDFYSDSYTYINAAAQHHAISFRPIGYSRFLEWLHKFTTSDTALVFIQYLVVQAGALLLFFSIRYFFPLQKIISNLLFAILMFNPIILYISNYISSDTLFIGLSLLWFTQLLWIINRPQWIQLFSLASLLVLIFTLRFAALYLPAIALLAFLFCRRNLVFKLAGIALSVVPIVIGIQRIKQTTENETGTAVFSAFGSWMSANNAMHMYPYIEVKDEDLPSSESVTFNHLVKKYFDTLPASERPYPSLTFKYLWEKNAPLKVYMRSLQMQNGDTYFNTWNAVAPVFSEFSSSLVKQHPTAFAHYFLWPNIKWYCVPPLESMVVYNTGATKVDSVAINWFKFKSEQVTCISPTIQETILQPMPYWFLLVNIAFCVLLVMVIVRVKQYSLPKDLLFTLLLAGGFWVTNFVFSIYAAPIVLRFQLFPMIIYSAFSLLLINILLAHRHHKSLSK